MFLQTIALPLGDRAIGELRPGRVKSGERVKVPPVHALICTANLGHLPKFMGLKDPPAANYETKKPRVSRPSRDRFRPANTRADSAGGGGRFGLRGAGFVHDGGADEVAPFGP